LNGKVFNPLVSIVIPVYNGANYLREAIDSSLAQTYANIEVLVINDGSNDSRATEEIALSFGDRIRYFSKVNGGVASALNLGISEMHGEYFSWLSHDDVYYPEKIEMQINLLDSLNNKNAIVFSGWHIIDSSGHVLNEVLPLERYDKEQLETPLFALLNGMISGCSLLIHKGHFERIGTFNEHLVSTQDFDLWFRMMRNQPCRICDGVLHKTRVHDRQGSKVLGELHIKESNKLWIYIMKQLTEEEMTVISGSVQKFYQDIFLLLVKYTNNKEAVQFAKKRAFSGFLGLVRINVITIYVLFRECLSLVKRNLLHERG